MKRIISLIALCIITQTFPIPTTGSVIGEFLETNSIERIRLQFVSDAEFYTTGGVQFVYPFEFSSPPLLLVSVSEISASPNAIYSAIITINTATDATITVYKALDVGAGVTITEADDGEVEVTIFALDPQYSS